MNIFAARRTQNSTKAPFRSLSFGKLLPNTSYKHRSLLIVDLNKNASEESATKLFVVGKFLQLMNASEPLELFIFIM